MFGMYMMHDFEEKTLLVSLDRFSSRHNWGCKPGKIMYQSFVSSLFKNICELWGWWSTICSQAGCEVAIKKNKTKCLRQLEAVSCTIWTICVKLFCFPWNACCTYDSKNAQPCQHLRQSNSCNFLEKSGTWNSKHEKGTAKRYRILQYFGCNIYIYPLGKKVPCKWPRTFDIRLLCEFIEDRAFSTGSSRFNRQHSDSFRLLPPSENKLGLLCLPCCHWLEEIRHDCSGNLCCFWHSGPLNLPPQGSHTIVSPTQFKSVLFKIRILNSNKTPPNVFPLHNARGPEPIGYVHVRGKIDWN